MLELNNQIKKEVKMLLPTETTIQTDWLQEEKNKLDSRTEFGERLPALKLQENKITEIQIDFSTPFNKWTDEKTKSTKSLVPVSHNGEKKIWWVNVKNPIYSQIIKSGAEGKTVLKVLQTGNLQNTRYTIVE